MYWSKARSAPDQLAVPAQRSLQDLRSIPWVFSWNQARFNLTGWFGTGAALGQFMEQYPEDFEILKTAARDWPFLKVSPDPDRNQSC